MRDLEEMLLFNSKNAEKLNKITKKAPEIKAIYRFYNTGSITYRMWQRNADA